jgi:hypothetical protein
MNVCKSRVNNTKDLIVEECWTEVYDFWKCANDYRTANPNKTIEYNSDDNNRLLQAESEMMLEWKRILEN